MTKISKTKYCRPTSDEINEIINATEKWIGILEAWRSDVGYNYSVESITDKDQLEHVMIEFILEIYTIHARQEYSPSSLMNCIRLLSVYILKHPQGTMKFNFGNRQEFAQLWEALNGKMKQLKKKELIFMWCCLLFQHHGGVDGNSDALIIPVPPDTEGHQGPVHDFKFYFSKRPFINKEAKGKNYM
ncbi:hypothetical protein Glove_52g174 [Diversispora epigaea]|uniref:Uncharacterized protein n=1 Tax=Diversispora epigaea TaxID=1348612 RepID=A0A397JJZ3_9GLOM|nr:hypothetical protein Glove_52g174 [Diversispora epigaea]